jgi:DNA repair ATPase RecN
MSDAAMASLVTGSVTIVTLVIGFLTLWIKLKYGVVKAEEAANNAQRVEGKIDNAATAAQVVAKNLAHNTELTSRIEKQTNGPLTAKLDLIEDHSARIAALEGKVESIKNTLDGMSKNLDSTRHELRGHLQTITNSIQLLAIKPVPTPAAPGGAS